jgi:hypothetical protein
VNNDNESVNEKVNDRQTAATAVWKSRNINVNTISDHCGCALHLGAASHQGSSTE